MNRFKCLKCDGDQFSASSDENTPCIYCGNTPVKKMDNINEDERTDKNEHSEKG